MSLGQKANSMIKLALVFFVTVLSFSIGTYVGKTYSDNQHRLAQLEPHRKTGDGAHDTTTSAAHEFDQSEEKPDGVATTNTAGAVNKESKLTDSEVAKIAEEFAAPEQAGAAHDERAIPVTENDEKEIKTISEPTTNHGTKATTGSRSSATAGKSGPSTATNSESHSMALSDEVATENTSYKTKDKEREPSSLLHYTIQVGSFPTELDAQKLTKDLLTKGIKTSYIPAQVNGQTYFRVNVGLFGTFKEADEYNKDFKEKTKMTSAFVQKIKN